VSTRHAWARALHRAVQRVFIAFGGPHGHGDSLEDAAENMPARMPARPAENPRHERVFIAFGGPTRSKH